MQCYQLQITQLYDDDVLNPKEPECPEYDTLINHTHRSHESALEKLLNKWRGIIGDRYTESVELCSFNAEAGTASLRYHKRLEKGRSAVSWEAKIVPVEITTTEVTR